MRSPSFGCVWGHFIPPRACCLQGAACGNRRAGVLATRRARSVRKANRARNLLRARGDAVFAAPFFRHPRRNRTMQLLDCIETQLISNRLPLVGVSVAAVPYANTPVRPHAALARLRRDAARRRDRRERRRLPAGAELRAAGERPLGPLRGARERGARRGVGAGLVGPRAPRGAAVRPPGLAARRSRSSAWAPSATCPIAIEGQPPDRGRGARRRGAHRRGRRAPATCSGCSARCAAACGRRSREDVTLGAGRLPQPALPAPRGADEARCVAARRVPVRAQRPAGHLKPRPRCGSGPTDQSGFLIVIAPRICPTE